MKGVGKIYYPGTPKKFDWPPKPDEVIDFNEAPSLERLQAAVEGYIELVPIFDTDENGNSCVVFCNEMGKHTGLVLNYAATRLWHDCNRRHRYQPFDFLLGRVIVLTGDDEFMESL